MEFTSAGAAKASLPPDSNHHTTADEDAIQKDSSSSSDTDVGSTVGSDSELDEESARHANYYPWEDIYGHVSELHELVANYEVIRDEMAQIGTKWCPWPETNLYEGQGEEWKVVPFVHTFPGNDENASIWMEKFCKLCPKTVALLKQIPGIRTALLSRMGPQTRLSAHRGWADLANHVLRCHLSLNIPGVKGDHKCGLWVRGEKRYHVNGELICFDDSKLHKAFNNHSTEMRSVLIFDLYRPDDLPRGTARKGHTDQLDDFIAYFR
jgi:ornithine lipid ester-linked acyl 2-hydroxylase|tara:strand:- start:127 stop:924 length:798 start_codon:yes stop_codon:yes gene_type:complete